MNLKQTFEKQGGMTLLKRYWKSRTLLTAIGQFLLLGRNRTALEILRHSTALKNKQKLEKRYKVKLEEFNKDWTENSHETSHKVWICWFQGMENAPKLVKKCYQSVKENILNKEIVLITSENLEDYVQFPDYIQEKIVAGVINGAHLSDLVRLELLLKHGGTWMDATVFCTSNNVPEYMFNSDLFLFQNLKPGKDGHSITISNWFITARSNNRILAATRYLLYKYWEENNEWVDYFLFHIFFQMVIEFYPEEWEKVIPFSNATPQILYSRLSDNYNENIWKAVTDMTPFHKLSYKFDLTYETEGTFYNFLITKNED